MGFKDTIDGTRKHPDQWHHGVTAAGNQQSQKYIFNLIRPSKVPVFDAKLRLTCVQSWLGIDLLSPSLRHCLRLFFDIKWYHQYVPYPVHTTNAMIMFNALNLQVFPDIHNLLFVHPACVLSTPWCLWEVLLYCMNRMSKGSHGFVVIFLTIRLGLVSPHQVRKQERPTKEKHKTVKSLN
jgi:hypothetical protein